MRVSKFEDKGQFRVPMARGESSNGEIFVMSLLTDGSGIVLEFSGEEAYLLTTQALVAEILQERGKTNEQT